MKYIKALENSSEFKFKMYIDYDKEWQVFYYNFFFEECKFVLKIVLTTLLNGDFNGFNDKEAEIKDRKDIDLKLERFDITKYIIYSIMTKRKEISDRWYLKKFR